ncbi:hypothetical protein GYK73_003335 [Salmonella enterica]|uniref:Uncharacterized protein n=2 Tax=Escherichia coli TaxID=562 RepID=A0A6G9I148_ECOLX|nr:hypothetical protein [Salmonella enterica subsp. enterica serovar Agbeni]EEG6867021.1 hypothetical protein [Salmonella enterica]EFH2520409.1 hypothetical protein [Escherichia coli]EFP9229997.1 hypothetical protein [Shigella flexneri]EFP9373036.1 hypothetical protein [Shigella sonnei]EGW4772677.1 hypothetical protein [Salmonella enterica subsp. enterica serovar 4,[5],12:i:-]
MFGVIMKTKTFRFRKYKKKNVLLQMIVSRKQVILFFRTGTLFYFLPVIETCRL